MSDRSLHVAIVTRTAIADGGVGVHVLRCAAILRARGCRVTMIAGSAPGDRDAVILPELVGGVVGESSLETLRRTVAACGADVVHFHSIDAPRAVRAVSELAVTAVSSHGWAGCAPNTKYFGTGRECHRAHGPGCIGHMLLSNCTHQRDLRPIVKYYREATTRLEALAAAHIAIAHSSAVCGHLKQNGISLVRHVPYPIDIPAEPPKGPEGSARVIFVGRLGPEKGVDVLLRSARYFAGDIDILGAGWNRSRLERTVGRLGLQTRVRFHGWCDREMIATGYAAAHVAVVPSIWPEPFGMVGPEAMAHCRPVVASSTGGIADWLEHGRTGLMVSPGDARALGEAIAELLGNPVEARAMGEAGRQRVVPRFSDDAHFESLLDAYRGALAGRS